MSSRAFKHHRREQRSRKDRERRRQEREYVLNYRDKHENLIEDLTKAGHRPKPKLKWVRIESSKSFYIWLECSRCRKKSKGQGHRLRWGRLRPDVQCGSHDPHRIPVMVLPRSQPLRVREFLGRAVLATGERFETHAYFEGGRLIVEDNVDDEWIVQLQEVSEHDASRGGVARISFPDESDNPVDFVPQNKRAFFNALHAKQQRFGGRAV